MKIPTFEEALKTYCEIARLERAKSERPSETTVRNVISGVGRILSVVHTIENKEAEDGLSEDPMRKPITWLSRKKMELFLAHAAENRINSTSAHSYLQHLKALTARWTRSYYADRGYRVPSFEMPVCRVRVNRYRRPERRILLEVKDWYDALYLREDKRDWLAATLMLEFAVRNGDVGRLKWSDFVERRIVVDPEQNDVRTCICLCYTPRKTSLSSGRSVSWPVHEKLWAQMNAARAASAEHRGTHFQGLVVPAAARVFKRLNKDLKSHHFFTGTHKGIYELRKICVDHIYQQYGAEKASAISGDDIHTVTQYYADPSAVNVVGVRIVDLL